MAVPAITSYVSTTLSTISLPPCSVMEVSQEDSVEEFTSPSRLSQFIYYSAFLGKNYKIEVPSLTETQLGTLRTFWETHKGRVIPFKWINPVDDVTYYVRFSSSNLTFERIAKYNWSCSFTLSQAHPLEVTEPDSSSGG